MDQSASFWAVIDVCFKGFKLVKGGGCFGNPTRFEKKHYLRRKSRLSGATLATWRHFYTPITDLMNE